VNVYQTWGISSQQTVLFTSCLLPLVPSNDLLPNLRYIIPTDSYIHFLFASASSFKWTSTRLEASHPNRQFYILPIYFRKFLPLNVCQDWGISSQQTVLFTSCLLPLVPSSERLPDLRHLIQTDSSASNHRYGDLESTTVVHRFTVWTGKRWRGGESALRRENIASTVGPGKWWHSVRWLAEG
jgi:hypothetical protein